MKILSFTLLFLSFCFACFAQISTPAPNQRFYLYKDFPSEFVKERNLEVWLPESYDSIEALPVLYMYDGQNMFHATEGWSGEYNRGWEVDECLDSLAKANLIRDVIVVGLYNGQSDRMAEYMPQKPEQLLAQRIEESDHPWYQSFKTQAPSSDLTLRYLVEEVKPYIDEHFKTLKDRDNTFIGGSSMGGIMSLYTICEYPEIFGGAACFSSHWLPLDGIFLEYVNNNLPDPKSHKIYFDYGTVGLDQHYEPFQMQVDEMMIEKGFDKTNWMTKKFIGEDHHEKAWRGRFDIPMKFLLAKENGSDE